MCGKVNTLSKREILSGYGAFSSTISTGQTIQRGFLRCYYTVRVEGREGFYVGFSVSRSLHTAAARNRARRWMREAYRLRKSILDPVSVKRANVVFLFSGRGTTHLDHRTRDEIHRFMTALLKELQEQLAANS